MNKEELRNNIEKLVHELEDQGKVDLAIEIKNSWDKTIIEYSKIINTYLPSIEIEDKLLNALRKELQRLSYDQLETEEILADLNKNRIIQTAPHIVPSSGPRMFFIDWLSSINSPNKYYFAGMYSGIPFSNNFYPGQLTFRNETAISKIFKNQSGTLNKSTINTDVKVNLMPSKMQDDLVYRSEIQDKTRETIKSLSDEIISFIEPITNEETDYTKWALKTQKKTISKVLKNINFIYFDLNEVVANYLVEAVGDKDHLIYKILFDEKTRNIFTKYFPDETLFNTTYQSGKYTKNEPLTIAGTNLIGDHTNIELKPEIIISKISKERLCPSTFLCFTVLCFLNGFKCLGSFRQAVYLPKYKKIWTESGLMYNDILQTIPCCNLTTGHFLGIYNNVRPLDILLEEKMEFNSSLLYGEILETIRENLLS